MIHEYEEEEFCDYWDLVSCCESRTVLMILSMAACS